MKKKGLLGDNREKESKLKSKVEDDINPVDLEFSEEHVDTPTNSSVDGFAVDSEVLEPRKSMPPLTSNSMLPARNANIGRAHHATSSQSEIESSWDMCVDAIKEIINKKKATSYEIENGIDDVNKEHINIKIKDYENETITVDKLNDGRAKITIPNVEHSKDFIRDFINNDKEPEVRIKNVTLEQAKIFIDACYAEDLHKLKFPTLKKDDLEKIEEYRKQKSGNETRSRPSP